MLNFFSIWWWMRLINWTGTISILLLNAVFILSDSRFLARLDLVVPKPYPQTRAEVMTNRVIILLNSVRGPVRGAMHSTTRLADVF
ncbi:hypothetical protein CONLIGDRAFT_676214 [Coniochaeta ligniaria NRRL 30616]|uniref:Uncharacterized protein n=1 Tax=Coniochaeta ligniaria NRRL 30616 TaxID=1408157 RepID=A0A1J7K4Y8_9PEZI|nr:hypothetical protein CONLIGDRAFT_676214 [Coniochaeta ligniaria NRRL 30616]